MSLLGLILNVSGLDGDTTLSLFRSLVDVSEIDELVASARNSVSQSLCDRSGKGGLAVVDVADGTNVNMRFGSLKLLLCHFKKFLLNDAL
jgi:hypothetical protein